MVDNQHRQINGNRDLPQSDVDVVNSIKTMEAEVAALWQHVAVGTDGLNRRWHALARTHFEEGFSALVRSVARPDSPFDAPPVDTRPIGTITLVRHLDDRITVLQADDVIRVARELLAAADRDGHVGLDGRLQADTAGEYIYRYVRDDGPNDLICERVREG